VGRVAQLRSIIAAWKCSRAPRQGRGRFAASAAQIDPSVDIVMPLLAGQPPAPTNDPRPAAGEQLQNS